MKKTSNQEILDKLPASISFLAANKLKQQRFEAEQQDAAQQQRDKSIASFENNLEFLPHQLRPFGNWRIWIILGGRGAGKTWPGSRQVIEHLREAGSNAYVIIVGPTKDSIRRVCLEGPSGLWHLYRHEFINYNKSDQELFHRRGGKVICISADKPARLEGPESSLLWGDEIGLWPELAWQNARLGCRHGENPRIILTTTPKNRKFLKDIVAEKTTVKTHGTSYDNKFLSDFVLNDWETQYKGTRIERQNLLGEFIDDVEGAYWQRAWIEDNRRTIDQCPEFVSIRIGVDPNIKKKSKNAETGITVAALGTDGHCYVLESSGYRLSPEGWGSEVVDAYYRFTADAILAEDNQGGDMVESTIRAAAGNGDGSGLSAGEALNIERITARVSKSGRAEPVSVLYKRGYVHHVGIFEILEDQFCSFPIDCEFKDRLDSAVYVVASLLLGNTQPTLSTLIEQKEENNKWDSLVGSSGKIDPLMR